MFYYMYDWGRAAMAPMGMAAGAAGRAASAPFAGLFGAQAGRTMAALGEVAERATRSYGRPDFTLESVEIAGKRRPAIHETVETHPFMTLTRFRVETRKTRPALLLAVPLSGHHAALLEETVAGLMATHDVYLTEWRDARTVPVTAGEFGLDDQVAHIAGALRRIGQRVPAIGFSQSTVPLLMAAASMAADDDLARPSHLALMAGPVDPRQNPNALNRFLASHPLDWFAANALTQVPVYYPGAMRRVYPGFVQLGSYIAASFEDQIDAHMSFFDNLVAGDGDSAQAHRDFYDRFLAVMDLPAKFFLDMVGRVFQESALAAGRMTWRGETIDPAAIRDMPLMTVEAGRDVLAAPDQTHAAHELIPHLEKRRRHRLTLPDAGHLGIVHGRAWRTKVLPQLAAFFGDG